MIYYSNGNYEAFARPKKPARSDDVSAYLIGSGLASLATAAFLIQDGHVHGDKIHILEELDIVGGSLGSFSDHSFIRGRRCFCFR